MLCDLFERFRGYDQWIPAEATVESSHMEDHELVYRGQTTHVYESADRLVWVDKRGDRHAAECEIPDDSPLYQMVGGEKVAIRYNPNNPNEYYFPELLRARINSYFFGIVALILFFALVIVPALLFFHVFKSKL